MTDKQQAYTLGTMGFAFAAYCCWYLRDILKAHFKSFSSKDWD